MKSPAVIVLVATIFSLSGCLSTERIASANPVSSPALQTGAVQEVSDDGLEYFDRNISNRAAHRSAWQLGKKDV